MRRLFYSDDEFNKVFSDKLKNYSVIPPTGNWASIYSKLNRRRNFRYTALIWTGTISTAVFILGFLIHYSTSNQKRSYFVDRASKHQLEVFSPVTDSHKTNTTESTKINLNNKSEVIATKSTYSNHVVSVKRLLNEVNSSIAQIGESKQSKNVGQKRNDIQIDVIKRENKVSLNTVLIIPVCENNMGNSTLLTAIPDMQMNTNKVIEIQNKTEIDPIIVNKEADQTQIKPSFTVTKDCSNSIRKFYGGIIADGQHTFLLSSTILKNPEYHYRFSPGYAFGVIGGYDVSLRVEIETGGIFSNENQNYSSSEISKRPTLSPSIQGMWAKLDYYRIPLLVKYKVPTSASKCVCDESFNIVAGVQYGRFITGSTYNGTSTYTLDYNYIKTNDLQFVTGIERSKAISKHIVYNIGLKFAYSSSQIASTPTYRLNDIYKPHNLNTGITLSLRYRL